jgi:hypothetical protein
LRIEPLEERRLLAITVDSLLDEADGSLNDGDISLRDAIALAPANETIDFSPDLTSGGAAAIQLTLGELTINKSLTIQGPGADLLTIDASANDPTPLENNGDGSRVFHIDDLTVALRNVLISGLRLTGGDSSGAGGAIVARENLTIVDSEITGNATTSTGIQGGGAIYSGTSTVRANSLTVRNSSLTGNLAVNSEGGAIRKRSGSLTIEGCTIGDNSALYAGGGVAASDAGVVVKIADSNIDDNACHARYAYDGGGGLFLFNAATTITGSTISGNSTLRFGGGIYQYRGSLTIMGGEISGNSARYSGGGLRNTGGSLNISGCTIANNSATYGDGGGLVAAYGSGWTVSGSTITGNAARGTGGGIDSRGNNLTLTDCTISDNSSTYGGGGGVHQISGVATLTRSAISGNSVVNGIGGGVLGRYSRFSISNSTLSNNSALIGGGVWAQGGDSHTISGSTISGNTATDETGRGGGLYFINANLAITGSVIKYNATAGGDGGGLCAINADVTIAGSSINNNVIANGSGGDGGGLFVQGVDLTISGSSLHANSAGDDGGGIWSHDGSVSVTQSTISLNFAGGDGAGLHLFASVPATLSIVHSTVADNVASAFGGGVFLARGTLELDHSIVARNFALAGPDLTGLIGAVFSPAFSLIGTNEGNGLPASPAGGADPLGNLIGPQPLAPLQVTIEMAAMGDFEAGSDSFVFEYSIDDGPFQPLFTSIVDEAASQSYVMNNGTQVVLDDPLTVGGVVLNKYFQLFTAVIPAAGAQVAIRFTATNDGPSEAFAWRNLLLVGQHSGTFVGSAVQAFGPDTFAQFNSDPDYTVLGDMFGIRSRFDQGIPSLPFDIVDDSVFIFPADVQGIISEFDTGRFFGVVDTVNGVGNDTNVATWKFNNVQGPIDPGLSPLAESGTTLPDGSRLHTHGLLAHSLAVDAGDPAAVAGVDGVPELDQRGTPFERIVGSRIDIGAVERQTLQLLVDTLADEDDGDYSAGDVSLREALKLSNGNFGVTDSIQFDAGLSGGTVLLTRGELTITDSVTITGLGDELLAVDASGNDPTPNESNGDGSRVMAILASGSTVHIEGLTITGADTPNDGGGIFATGAALTIVDCTITGNAAALGRGGGLFKNYGYDLTITGSTISGNSARYSGGGIVSYGNVAITSSRISNNSTKYDRGGGIAHASGRLTITDSAITGNSAGVGGSWGGGISAHFGSELNVTRSTISDNSAGIGGGIYAIYVSTLNVTDCTISGNSALNGSGGGIFHRNNNLRVAGSTISGNSAANAGGGIWAQANVDITTSTISDNTSSGDSGHGGGVFTGLGQTTIALSTISRNRANGNGGGINVAAGGLLTLSGSTIDGNQANGNGGGMFAPLVGAEITNCTISGNFATNGSGGGLYLADTPYISTTIRHSTITFNAATSAGGVMLLDGTLTLDHSIVATNFASFGPDLTGLLGSTFAATFSLISNNAKSGLAEAPVNAPDANGNRIGGPTNGMIDPGLSILQDNGGPTPTHALLGSSPALNGGDPLAANGVGTVPGADQRGAPFVRVAGGQIDIGAYERQVVAGVLLVDTLADENDGNYSAGDFSLREALGIANGSVGANTIMFADALTSGGPATISLTRGELWIREAVGIGGPGAHRLTIDAAGNDPTPDAADGLGSRVFLVDDHNPNTFISVQIAGLALTGGDVPSGGAIYNRELLTLNSSVVSGNAAIGGGGGIYSIHGNLSLNASTISGNSATDGGGIFSFYGLLTVNGSIISDNMGRNDYGRGGGIARFGRYSGAAGLNVTATLISGNSAGRGGGIYARYGGSSVSGSIISGNAATGTAGFAVGGGIEHRGNAFNALGVLTVMNSTISGNTAAVGGGIASRYGTLLVTASTISGNEATSGTGGGIEVVKRYGATTITSSTISGNTAAGAGGGLNNAYGRALIRFSTITLNQSPAGMGSGVSSNPDTTRRTEVHSSIIAGNVNSDIDLAAGGTNTFLSLAYNLVGTGTGMGAFNHTGDQAGVDDPLLGPLQDNGGLTWTHAPLAGSPAIDTGDPAALPGVGGVPSRDQRGAPFTRVSNGDDVPEARIDIGALELQPIPIAMFGDYNVDGVVDSSDFVVWRKTFGSSVTPYSGADGSGNGVIDQPDHHVWMARFGRTLPGFGGSSLTAAARPAITAPPPSDEFLANWPDASGAPATRPADAINPVAVTSPQTILPVPSRQPATDRAPAIRAAAQVAPAAALRDHGLLAWLATQTNAADAAHVIDVLRHAPGQADTRSLNETLETLELAFESLGV